MSEIASDQELARAVRQLVRGSRTAALATTFRGEGAPYASLVAVATDTTGAPILLLSDLAEHCQNLTGDNRASLLFAAVDGLEAPLTGLRVSLQGRLEKSTETRHRQRFLNRHADACDYVDFGDFSIYHLHLDKLHLVSGFGVIRWLGAEEYLLAEQEGLAEEGFSASVIAHMNQDHGDALDQIAGDGASGWQLTDFDGEGIDIRRAAEVRRVAFEVPIRSQEEVRGAMVALTLAARGEV
jgi:putative heme iron utilization protein